MDFEAVMGRLEAVAETQDPLVAFIEGDVPATGWTAGMDQTGHRSLPVMRGCIGSGTLFKENAAAQVGP